MRFLVFICIKEEIIFLLAPDLALLATRVGLFAEVGLFNTLKLTHHWKWALVLLHILIVVVESPYGETPRHAARARHDDALWSATPGGPNSHFLLRVRDEFLVCIGARFNNWTSSPFIVDGIEAKLLSSVELRVATTSAFWLVIFLVYWFAARLRSLKLTNFAILL